MIQIQENVRTDRRMDGQMEGRKDGQTLFHRTLPTTAASPIIKADKCCAVVIIDVKGYIREAESKLVYKDKDNNLQTIIYCKPTD